MVCEKCGKQLSHTATSCDNCGTVFQPQKQIKKCIHCDAALPDDSAFCPKCGNSQNPISSKDTKTKKGLLITIVILLFLTIATVGVFIGISLAGDDKPKTIASKNNDSDNTRTSDDVSHIPVSEPTLETKSLEGPIVTSPADSEQNDTVSENTDEQNPTDILDLDNEEANEHESEDSDATSEYIVLTEYDYEFGKTTVQKQPTYTQFSYSDIYTCMIPAHFEKKYMYMSDADYNNYAFIAPDDTAVITLTCEADASELSAEELLKHEIASTDGTVTYSPHGDTWYAISTDYNNLVGYQKTFVTGEKIISFEMVFPSEYLEIYKNYIEYIEDNFRPIE